MRGRRKGGRGTIENGRARESGEARRGGGGEEE